MIRYVYLVIFLLTYLIFYFVNKIIYNKNYRFNTVFNTIWIFCISYHLLNINDYYLVSDKVNFYSLIVIITFNISYYIFSNKTDRIHIDFSNVKKDINVVCNSKLIIALNIMAYLFIIPILVNSIIIIQSLGFEALRAFAFDSSMGLASTLQLTIIQYVIQPLYSIMIILSCISIVLKCNNKLLYLLTLIDIIVYVVTNGGRMIVFQTIIFFLGSVFLFYRDKIMQVIKERFKLIIFLLLVIVISYYLVSLRSAQNITVIQNIFSYFSGTFNFMTQVLEHNVIEIGAAPLQLIFGFIIEPIQMFLNLLGGSYELSNYIITSPLSGYLVISSDGGTYNALATMMTAFLIDSGVLGIVIGTIVFSYICTIGERGLYKNGSARDIIMYVFMFYNLIISVQRYPFYNTKFLISVILIILITKKSKRVIIKL